MGNALAAATDSSYSKHKEAHDLSKALRDQMAIRKAYGLSNEGTLKIQKVKPSGVDMGEKHKHEVRIFIDDSLVVKASLPDHEYTMGFIKCTCEIPYAPCKGECARGQARLRKKQRI